MNADIQRGITRVCIVLSVLWIIGMGWYQHEQSKKSDTNSVTLSLSDDKQLRIDATGIQQQDPAAKQNERLAILLIPALLLLLAGPVSGWLVGGFRKKENVQ